MTTFVPKPSPPIARRPMNRITTSPVPSETTASSDSLSFIGNTVSRRITPAILTRLRNGASAMRTEPGTVSAHSRISDSRRVSSLSVRR